MTGHPTKRLVQQQFGKNPTGYVTSVTHAHGSDLARLVELIQPQPDWLILDVATGGGHTAGIFAPYVKRVIASDLTFSMLAAARQHLSRLDLRNVACQQLDAEAIPCRNGSVDLVTCRVAAHHFPAPQQFVIEAARVTRVGGLVAVIDQIVPPDRKAARYVNALERLRDPSHAWAYSLSRWMKFFAEAGLEVTHTESFERRHQITEWADRMHCTPEITLRLRVMLTQAPERAAEWLRPELHPQGDGTFSIHQGLLIGRKV